MTIGILGKKIGMSRTFDENGAVIPVTLIEAGPCPVLQIKTVDRDGYSAVQVGYEPRKEGRVNKPMGGHLKGAGVKGLPRVIRELRTEETEDLEVGSALTVEMFEPGQMVDVSGTSIGRGFAGPIKRHNNSRGPETHGSRYHRRTGSIGQSADPSKVFKGKPMAGQMGNEKVTIQNLQVVQADKEKNLLVIKGCIPGHKNGYVLIRAASRERKKKTA